MFSTIISIIFIIIAAIYFILPTDLLPDVLGVLGRVDDFVLMFYLYYRYKKLQGKCPDFEKESDTDDNASGVDRDSKQQKSKPLCPYETLGVDKSASIKEIKSAYKKLMAQYHPDKVNHLGDDLKELANKKALEIQEAYQQLSR